MKRFPKTEFLTPFSIVLGIIGMAQQSWMLSEIDSQGLLPKAHPGGVMAVILLAVVIAVCFFLLKNVRTAEIQAQLFPRSILAAGGNFFVAGGLGFSAFTGEAAGALFLFVKILGVLSALALILVGVCRLKRQRPSCLLHVLVVLFLIFRTLLRCQAWSAETQVPLFFFPLLAHLFLLLAVYFRAALEVDMKNCRHYLFFRQLALFCCLASMAGGDWLFYLSGAVWMAMDFCIPDFYGKYAV